MQERQSSPFDSESLTTAERRALRRARRVQAFSLGVGASVLALFAVGCPGPADLANPGDYPTTAGMSTGGGATAGSGTGGNAPVGDPCETACIKEAFQTNPVLCKLCHNNNAMSPLKSAMLDLATDGFTARLKNVPATHTELGTGMTAADCPTGDKLIDTTNPANSWLLKKVRGEQGNCGGVMPAGGATPAQKACIEAYVACVAPGGAAPVGGTSSGGASAGTSSGGTGGTSSAGTASGGTGGAKGGSSGSGGA